MAKKRKSQNPPQQEFNNNPFKNLKGLSVSEPEKPAKQPDPAVKELSSPGAKEQVCFAGEMADMGVKPLFAGENLAAKTSSVPAPSKPSRPSRVAKDQDEFLDAIGSLDVTFKDQWPEEDAVAHAQPRRMKQVEKGQLKPEAELDLHGMTRDEAMHRARLFLQNAVHHNQRTVLIITGKGYHSAEGPVLRRAVEQLLGEMRDVVMEWGQAPRRYGGSGALVVFLRKKTTAGDEQ